VIPAANGRLAAGMIDGSDWTSATWVVAQLEVPGDAVQEAFRQARGRGAHTILNAAPAGPFPAALWTLTDLLVVNETEAALLSGRSVIGLESAVAAARGLRGAGPSVVAVTMGAEGAVIVTSDGAWHVPALQVAVVDTTAAGDAWVGALAARLAGGADLVAASVSAAVAAAVAVTRRGAQPSLPFGRDVEARLPDAPTPRRLS